MCLVDSELGKKRQKTLKLWREVWILSAQGRVSSRGVRGSDLICIFTRLTWLLSQKGLGGTSLNIDKSLQFLIEFLTY